MVTKQRNKKIEKKNYSDTNNEEMFDWQTLKRILLNNL